MLGPAAMSIPPVHRSCFPTLLLAVSSFLLLSLQFPCIASKSLQSLTQSNALRKSTKTMKLDDWLLKTDNRTEIGTSLDVVAIVNTGTAAICPRGASEAIRVMHGGTRGTTRRKADTTRTTAVTTETTGGSACSHTIHTHVGRCRKEQRANQQS